MKIRFSQLSCIVLCFLSISTACFGAVSVNYVVYCSADKVSKGFLAEPTEKGRYPALILIHEWWGLNDNIRKNAIRFAELGYVALAVDLYDGRLATVPDEARALSAEARKNMSASMENLKGAIDFLKERKNVSGDRMGTVGWCFGGGWSYQLAKNNLGLGASVIYYGQFDPKDDLSKMNTSILGHFGDKDVSITVETVHALRKNLESLKGDHAIYLYENAEHAFANEGGQRYKKDAAELAWSRTVDFLKRKL